MTLSSEFSKTGTYTGSFVPKKVLALAPDIVVFINGDTSVPICSKCGAKKDIRDDITSVSVSLGIDSVPGRATINMKIPTYQKHAYFKYNRFVFTPMQEVNIFCKGRFLDENGIPRYYPIFWGLITSVNLDESPGSFGVSINCADILRWLEITNINVNPAAWFTSVVPEVNMTTFVNKYGKLNPYEIIVSLMEIGYDEMVLPDLPTLGDGNKIPLAKDIKSSQEGIINYWRKRFKSMSNSLRIYDGDGCAVEFTKGDASIKEDKNFEGGDTAPKTVGESQSTNNINPKMVTMQTGVYSKTLPFGELSGGSDVFNSNYNSKLSIAKEVAEYIGYEFFMDSTGDIVFKPPFYNLNVKGHKVYEIDDLDLKDISYSENESAVYTYMQVNGRVTSLTEGGMAAPRGFHIDPDLAEIYGLRVAPTQYTSFVRTHEMAQLYAITELDRVNMDRFDGSCTIPIRPELRVGFPVYIKSKDIFVYVTSISHSFSFGSSATTNLSFNAIRRKFLPKEILLGKKEPDRPSYPNYVKKFEGMVSKENIKDEANKESVPQQQDVEEILKTQEYSNAFKGIKMGSWKEYQDNSTNYTISKDGTMFPISDAQGYEHLGGFPYGANIRINPETNKLEPVPVDLSHLAANDSSLKGGTTYKVPNNIKTLDRSYLSYAKGYTVEDIVSIKPSNESGRCVCLNKQTNQ